MLYAIATMWFIGILSQIIFRQLYLGIVRPVEEEKERAYAEGERLKQKYDIEKVEEIDMVAEKK
jgi:cellobiose-specific phosphotransferase system component IIC